MAVDSKASPKPSATSKSFDHSSRIQHQYTTLLIYNKKQKAERQYASFLFIFPGFETGVAQAVQQHA